MQEENVTIEIVKAIRDLCNDGHKVSFEKDWGGNSLTVWIDDKHTHVGVKEEDFSLMAENLKNVLTGGPGLSFV